MREGNEMQKTKMKKIVLKILVFTICILGMGVMTKTTSAATMKISYNGRTYKYKKTQIKVKLDNKSVTSGKKKGILIKGTCMVSYKDVFRSGAKATCTYSKSSKKITLKKNGVTIKMWIGKKYAYVNGKKKKLSVAPVNVRYIKGNKYRILVPAKFVAKTLKYKYSYNSKTGYISMTTPFKLKVGSKVTYYTNYRGNVSYNNKTIMLNSMPALNIGGGTLVPAKEVFQNIMGITYSYDSATQTITLVNQDKSIKAVLTIGSNIITVNDKQITTKVVPQKIKRYDTKKTIVCVPVNILSKQFGYYYSWDKLNYLSKIHVKTYFNWNVVDTTFDSSRYSNAIHKIDSTYNNTGNSIIFQVTGTSADIMKQATVAKNGNVVTVTIPKSLYKLNEKQFNQFGEIVSSFDVNQTGTDTVLSFTSTNAQIDYAYAVTDNVFKIEIFNPEYVGTYSLRISKPAGVTFDMVSNTDYYNNNRFVITIKGNHIDYFNSNPIAVNNSVITSVKTSLNTAGNTEITVQCSKLQGFKIYDKNGSFLVAMDAPNKIYNKIVVLDAGHGGTDPGAIGNNTREKNLNFLMMVTLMQKHFASNAPDIKAYWTRTTDTLIPLGDRAAFASKVGADIFVSLHMNSWTKSSVNGTEVYYSSSNNTASFSGITSKKMASLFCNRLVSAMGTTNRGISSQKYTVVHKNTVPAVLLELGFISGSSDFPKLNNPVYQEKATQTIYNTIVEIFNTYPTGR